jgi:hypothetical protein
VTRASANGRPEPFDLEAAAQAAAAEAEALPFAFTYRGASYQVPPMTAWPISALRALASGNLDAALGELLGADAYEALADAGLKVGDLNVLFDKIGAEAGMGSLPNSPAQPRPASTRT